MTVLDVKRGFWGDGNGYDWIESSRSAWRAVPSWGRDGWDLGDWPYVIVSFAERDATGGRMYGVCVYVEGDLDIRWWDSRDERDAYTDDVALFYWRRNNEPWVDGVEDGDVPDRLSGSFSWDRCERGAER